MRMSFSRLPQEYPGLGRWELMLVLGHPGGFANGFIASGMTYSHGEERSAFRPMHAWMSAHGHYLSSVGY